MRTIKTCRSCGGKILVPMFDLGEQYTSDFREDDSKPPKYPLEAIICEDCMLVQLRHTTPSGDMYHENYGFKSGVSDSIKADLKENVELGLEYKPKAKRWLDIASNDGTLLSFVPKSIWRAGVDPIAKLCLEAEAHANYIVNDFFAPGQFDFKFDVITSISMFYDLDDPNKFVSGVKEVLDDNGIWIIQQNYLLPTLNFNAVDNFCHEHLEYYTLLSLEPLLERHGLEVIRVHTNLVNGGSIRTVVAKHGAFTPDRTVEAQRRIERDAHLGTYVPYDRFSKDVMKGIRELKMLCFDLHKQGKTIYILAASTRGSTIWQAAGLTSEVTPYAVERNPAKVGRYFSAVGIPIISEEQMRKDKPDYLLIGPWFYVEEIKKREASYLRKGGHFILPLPKLEIV